MVLDEAIYLPLGLQFCTPRRRLDPIFPFLIFPLKISPVLPQIKSLGARHIHQAHRSRGAAVVGDPKGLPYSAPSSPPSYRFWEHTRTESGAPDYWEVGCLSDRPWVSPGNFLCLFFLFFVGELNLWPELIFGMCISCSEACIETSTVGCSV